MQSYFFKLQHCNTTYIRVTNLYTVKKAVAQWLESQSALLWVPESDLVSCLLTFRGARGHCLLL